MASIRNAILGDVKTTLAGVEGMTAVYRWDIPTPTEQSSYPYAIVRDTTERYQQAESVHYRTLSVAVDIYAKTEFTDDDAVGTYACDLLASIETALMEDAGRGTSNGLPNAVDTVLRSNSSVVNRGADPFIQITLNFDVTYRTRLGDPSRQTP